MYWTVIVPWVPREFQTEWHPTEQGGPFDPLSRGAFKTESEAIAWAREHLKGAPYTLKPYESPDVIERLILRARSTELIPFVQSLDENEYRELTFFNGTCSGFWGQARDVRDGPVQL